MTHTVEIRNRFTGAVIFTAEVEAPKNASAAKKLGLAVLLAIAAGADLYGADLSHANLSGADLSGADLYGANLSGAKVRDEITITRWRGDASRGDHYVFRAFENSAGETYILAGCRSFLRSEYDAHIEANYPGTAKARATYACLDYLESLRADFGDVA